MLSYPERFPLKFSHFFYLNIICLLIPIFCFADNNIEQVIRDRLSKDKKTLDLVTKSVNSIKNNDIDKLKKLTWILQNKNK